MANPIMLPDGSFGTGYNPRLNGYAPTIESNAFSDFSGQSVNNTSTSDSLPMGLSSYTGVGAAQDQNIPYPTGYKPQPIGGPGSMQSTYRNQDAVNNTDKTQDPKWTDPSMIRAKEIGGAASAGLDAGSSVPATPDSTDAMLGVAGATLSGAAMGAVAGGPVGAAVGGLVGLVSGGINAYVGTHSARQNARKAERVNQQLQARQDAKDAQRRADELYMFNTNKDITLEQMRYNRKQAALQETYRAHEEARKTLNDMISQDQNLKDFFLRTAR